MLFNHYNTTNQERQKVIALYGTSIAETAVQKSKWDSEVFHQLLKATLAEEGGSIDARGKIVLPEEQNNEKHLRKLTEKMAQAVHDNGLDFYKVIANRVLKKFDQFDL